MFHHCDTTVSDESTEMIFEGNLFRNQVSMQLTIKNPPASAAAAEKNAAGVSTD
jgi:hypothetical protein